VPFAEHAACALALLRTALLRLVLRCGSGPTKTVFERVAAHPPVAAWIGSPSALSRERT